MRPGHSARRVSAPVRDPSPPQTTKASMPSLQCGHLAITTMRGKWLANDPQAELTQGFDIMHLSPIRPVDAVYSRRTTCPCIAPSYYSTSGCHTTGQLSAFPTIEFPSRYQSYGLRPVSVFEPFACIFSHPSYILEWGWTALQY